VGMGGEYSGEQWSTGGVDHTASFEESLDFCVHSRFLINEGL